ncbi:hypothetical protein EfmAA818_31750 (plasmid) [Enterococcus faecium]|nr:hypothetical protein EfmAA818_31750 [Enterococcus faecium]
MFEKTFSSFLGDTIFIGPGTTLEQLALELKGRKGYKIRVITNSLPDFCSFNQSQNGREISIQVLQKSFTFYNLLIKRSYFIFVLYKI